jgi:hypothetical protein
MALVCFVAAAYLFFGGYNPQWAAGAAGLGVIFFISDVAVQQKRSVDLEDLKKISHQRFEKLVVRAFEKKGWNVTFIQSINPFLDAIISKRNERRILKIVNIVSGEPYDLVDKLLRLIPEADANGLAIVDRSEHPDYQTISQTNIWYIIGPDLVTFLNDAFGVGYNVDKILTEPSPAERLRQVQMKYPR